MVVKLQERIRQAALRFESSVISYGSEAKKDGHEGRWEFESSVISYGSEADGGRAMIQMRFESSVISYGSEARFVLVFQPACLRVV